MAPRRSHLKPLLVLRLILLFGLLGLLLATLMTCCIAHRKNVLVGAPAIIPSIEIGSSDEGPKALPPPGKPAGWKHFIPRITYAGAITPDSMQKIADLVGAISDMHVEALILEIDTDGGDVRAGFSLMRAIEDSDVPVYCVVDGHAWSMGYYILQSCDVRIMTRRSTLMVHKANFQTSEGAETIEILKDKIKGLEAISLGLEEQATRRICMSREELDKKISTANWFMGADEALKTGSVDLVIGTGAELQKGLIETGVLPPLPKAPCVPRDPPQKAHLSP